MQRFADFAGFQAWLDGLGLFRMELSLGRMRAFREALGRRPSFAVAHVVGTNGKGSTCAMLAGALRASGLKVGLYSSPHFLSLRERVVVDGRTLPESDWRDLANETARIAAGIDLTYFEFLTALGILAFERAGVAVAVMEAGLGGRFDATNVFDPALTLFTPIGLDHMGVLGSTLADIARDKADAMRADAPAAAADQPPEAWAELAARAREIGARLVRARDLVPDAGIEGLSLTLAGAHQRENARLALAGVGLLAERLGLRFDPAACRQGIGSAFVPGRMQFAPGRPGLILDGAHNEPALVALRAALAGLGIRPAGLVFDCLRDKDIGRMLPHVLALTDGLVLVPELPGVERAWPANALAARLGARARPVADAAEALREFAGLDGPVLVCGSLYLLAEVFRLRPELLEGEGEPETPQNT